MANEMTPVIYNGERILTTEQLAKVYECNERNISDNFNNHLDRFEKGKHYYLLQGDALRSFKREYDNIGVAKNVNKLYLWTERGADRHCKILDTDMAWEQFDNLEETYFKVKENKKELQLYKIVQNKLANVESRVKSLEETKTIDYTKQLALQNLGKSKVVSALGGINSPAYRDKHIRNKTFSEMWGGYKNRILVNSYKNTAVKDFEVGRDFLTKWKPPQELKEQIEIVNSQMGFFN